jgi:hypothetical protein
MHAAVEGLRVVPRNVLRATLLGAIAYPRPPSIATPSIAITQHCGTALSHAQDGTDTPLGLVPLLTYPSQRRAPSLGTAPGLVIGCPCDRHGG